MFFYCLLAFYSIKSDYDLNLLEKNNFYFFAINNNRNKEAGLHDVKIK